MPDLVALVPEALRPVLPWIFVGSLVTFVGTLVGLPIVVARLPVDFFAHEHREPFRHEHPVLHVVLVLLKNLVGAVFLLAGIAMLVLPGQGLLTILLGLVLIDFPGKQRFEDWLIERKTIRRGLQWIRKRARREPLRFREEGDPTRDSAGRDRS